jgi:hypothetical protein
MNAQTQQHFVDDSLNNEGIHLATSRTHCITVCEKKYTGNISLFVIEFGIKNPYAHSCVEIEGYGNKYTATTDANGYFFIEHVPAGQYSASINDKKYFFHTVEPDSEPYQLWIEPLPSEQDEPKEYDDEEYVLADEDEYADDSEPETAGNESPQEQES